MAPKKNYRSHPYSERMRVVALYKQGYGSKSIAKLLGIDDSMVRAWLRKYREKGIEALRPYAREGKPDFKRKPTRCEENAVLYESALLAFASTLEPVASITRRHQLDYHAFKYYVERYRPELVAQRERLKINVRYQ